MQPTKQKLLVAYGIFASAFIPVIRATNCSKDDGTVTNDQFIVMTGGDSNGDGFSAVCKEGIVQVIDHTSQDNNPSDDWESITGSIPNGSQVQLQHQVSNTLSVTTSLDFTPSGSIDSVSVGADLGISVMLSSTVTSTITYTINVAGCPNSGTLQIQGQWLWINGIVCAGNSVQCTSAGNNGNAFGPAILAVPDINSAGGQLFNVRVLCDDGSTQGLAPIDDVEQSVVEFKL